MMMMIQDWLAHVSLLFLVGCIILVSIASLNMKRGRKEEKESRNIQPPGPFRLPVIGNLHLLLIGSMPHVTLHNMAAKYGPIMSLMLGRVPIVVVSSPGLAREVLVTHDLEFADRPHLVSTEVFFYKSTSVAFSPYGPFWRALRKIFYNSLLSPRYISSCIDIRREEVGRMLHRISSAAAAGSALDLTYLLVLYANRQTSRSAFGRESLGREDYFDQHGMVKLLNNYHILLGGFTIPEFFPSMHWVAKLTGTYRLMWKTREKLDSFLNNVIADRCRVRRAQGRDGKGNNHFNFFDALLDLQDQGQDDEEEDITLTADNIKANLLTVFGANTPALALDWAMTELVMNPQAIKRAQEEMDKVLGGEGVGEGDLDKMEYLKAILKETLRLHPPVPLLLPRISKSKDILIDGYRIPAGTTVYINAWAIGRDPGVWEDPYSFKPERFLGTTNSCTHYTGQDFQLLPFGAGRRGCPAMNFSMVAVELALAQLLYYFHWELPPGHHQPPLAQIFGISIYKKENLKVIPKLRRPLPSIPLY